MTISAETGRLAEYLAGAADRPLPPEVADKTRLHVLDTIAAIISGSEMPAGIAGREYARRHGAGGDAPVLGSDLGTDPVHAALANGMSGHADETDDSHAPSLSHPGCAVIPAVLAVAPGRRMTGDHLLRAVAAGYDAGTRIGMAIGHPESPLEGSAVSTHAHVGLHAAATAAAVAGRFDEERVRWLLSYAGQSAAGTTSWARDRHHVEKAFVFAGMPASGGVRAAQIVEAGWPGVDDPFADQPNVLEAYSSRLDRAALVDGLGERYEIMRTNIKKFAVGSPSQAPVQAALDLLAERPVRPADLERVVITLPHDLAHVVDGRDMPNINVQYLVAGTIADARFSFAMAHDDARLAGDDEVRSLMDRTDLVYDQAVTGVRQASVEFVERDGGRRSAFVASVRGTAQDPMSQAEVVEKARDLIQPVVGEAACTRIVESVLGLGSGVDADRLLAALAGAA